MKQEELQHSNPICVIIMGVSGCGKTTAARQLTQAMTSRYPDMRVHMVEGDEHHPPENVQKMQSGIPLTDQDRIPWLDSLIAYTKTLLASPEAPVDSEVEKKNRIFIVLTCSALKKSYRTMLRTGLSSHPSNPAIKFVHLYASYETIAKRLQERQGHFMPAQLLKSQFETLEWPDADEPDVVGVDVSSSEELGSLSQVSFTLGL